MGIRTTLSILRFELHTLGAVLIVALLMGTMFYFFGSWQQDYTVLISFATVIFLISLVRIDIGIAVLIVGMLFSPETEVGESGARAVTIRAEDLLILSLTMAWVVRSVLMGIPFRSTPLNLPIGLFVIALVLSTVGGYANGWIHEPITALFYIGKLVEFFVVYFFTVNMIEEEKQVFLFLGLFLAVGAVVSLYGLSQVGEVQRITAPFEGETPEPNTFGGYLMTVIALTVPFSLYAPTLKLRLGPLVVAALAFMALLFTLSRASFLALIGMFLMLGILSRSRVIWFGFIVFMLVHEIILPQDVFDRINYTFQSPSGVEVFLPFNIPGIGDTILVDSSTHERIDIWRKVLFTWTYDFYYFFFGWGVTRGGILDSQFARFLVEIGLVGTGLFVFLLWRILRSSYWLVQNAGDWWVKSFAIGYVACFVGVLIHSLGTITFYIVRIMEPFWFLTGLLMWWYLREREKQDKESVAPGKKGNWQPDLPWRQVDAS